MNLKGLQTRKRRPRITLMSNWRRTTTFVEHLVLTGMGLNSFTFIARTTLMVALNPWCSGSAWLPRLQKSAN
jgi:hypothetical protein